MVSVALESFGGPEVLKVHRAATPTPQPDQIRVRVEFATVNPTDTLFRKGAQERLLESPVGPWVPGMELAGVVDQLGANCADSGFRPGDLVVGLVNPRRSQGGAYSTFVCLRPTSLALRPASIPGPEAATLPMNGVTALMALEALSLSTDKSVLVTGGAGALGGYTMQLARAAGMTVIGQGRPGDEETMRKLGAAHVLTSADALPSAVHALLPQGVDALVDTAILGGPAEAAVRDGGVVVHVRPTAGDDDPRLRHAVVSVTKRIDDKLALERVVTAAEEGILTPRVATVLEMSEAPEAHRLVEHGGLRGRVVLDMRLR